MSAAGVVQDRCSLPVTVDRHAHGRYTAYHAITSRGVDCFYTPKQGIHTLMAPQAQHIASQKATALYSRWLNHRVITQKAQPSGSLQRCHPMPSMLVAACAPQAGLMPQPGETLPRAWRLTASGGSLLLRSHNSSDCRRQPQQQRLSAAATAAATAASDRNPTSSCA